MDCFGASLCAAAYLENREEGQGLGGRHFTQGGRPAVVIAGTFREKFFVVGGRLRAPIGAFINA